MLVLRDSRHTPPLLPAIINKSYAIALRRIKLDYRTLEPEECGACAVDGLADLKAWQELVERLGEGREVSVASGDAGGLGCKRWRWQRGCRRGCGSCR
jgi:hypothetical protein